jgi:hypothetical protein
MSLVDLYSNILSHIAKCTQTETTPRDNIDQMMSILRCGLDALAVITAEEKAEVFSPKYVGVASTKYKDLHNMLLSHICLHEGCQWVRVIKQENVEKLSTDAKSELVPSDILALQGRCLLKSEIYRISTQISSTYFERLVRSGIIHRHQALQVLAENNSPLFSLIWATIPTRRRKQIYAQELLESMLFPLNTFISQRQYKEDYVKNVKWNLETPSAQMFELWSQGWRQMTLKRLQKLYQNTPTNLVYFLLSQLRRNGIMDLLRRLMKEGSLYSRLWLLLLLNDSRSNGIITVSMATDLWETLLDFVETDSIGVYLDDSPGKREEGEKEKQKEKRLYALLRCFIFDLSGHTGHNGNTNDELEYGNYTSSLLEKSFTTNLYLYEYVKNTKQYDLTYWLQCCLEKVITSVTPNDQSRLNAPLRKRRASLHKRSEGEQAEEQDCPFTLSKYPDLTICKVLKQSVTPAGDIPVLPYSIILDLYLHGKLLVILYMLTSSPLPETLTARKSYHEVHSLGLSGVPLIVSPKTIEMVKERLDKIKIDLEEDEAHVQSQKAHEQVRDNSTKRKNIVSDQDSGIEEHENKPMSRQHRRLNERKLLKRIEKEEREKERAEKEKKEREEKEKEREEKEKEREEKEKERGEPAEEEKGDQTVGEKTKQKKNKRFREVTTSEDRKEVIRLKLRRHLEEKRAKNSKEK